MDRTCEVCGAAFKTAPAKVRAGNGRFCSQECFQGTQRNQVDRTCETCGTHFMAKLAFVKRGTARYCSQSCSDLARRGPKKPGVRHRMMRAKGHPIAPPSGTVPIGRIVLYERLGPGSHPCHWCGRMVEWKIGAGVRDSEALLADHLDHDPTNDAPDNLVASCNPCNSHRRVTGTTTIEEGTLTVERSGQRTRAVERVCESCGADFLAALSQVKIGKGRFCSRSCARSKPSS